MNPRRPRKRARRSAKEFKSPGVDISHELARRIGVARVARVTGLDRAGIEVACAMRPGGHVLQVSNGKGSDAAQARLGALLEAAELWAAENPDPARLISASLAELEEQGALVWPLADQLVLQRTFSPALRIAWIAAGLLAPSPKSDLETTGERLAPDQVLIPAAAVHCVPSRGPWLGPAVHRWTSNGMGAHPEGERALCHALLEAAERDGLARALPHGWTRAAMQRRKLDADSLRSTMPRAAALVAGLRDRGLSLHLFDLHPDRARSRPLKWMQLALAGALLVDDEGGPDGSARVAAGYACALDHDAAFSAATLEAAQSRLTDVHGAREDIEGASATDHTAMKALAAACASIAGKITATALVAGERDFASSESRPLSAEIVRRFAAAGFAQIAAIDLAPADFPARVIKVIAPGLLLSELLQ